MEISTVAILSPGDMGHAVGQRLRENELDVITCLAGRSQRTRDLAEKAGIRDVGSMRDLVEQSDLVMSMTVSAAVPGLCREVADAVKETSSDLLFAECNAIAPQLTRELEPVITGAGARFVDVSIIGGPPRPGYSPHFYTSGEQAGEFAQLNSYGLEVIELDGEVGKASGIKMCYAAMTKGTSALYSELLIAAELMGLTEALLNEFQSGQSAVLQRMERNIPTVPPRSAAVGQRNGGNTGHVCAPGYDASPVRGGGGNVPVYRQHPAGRGIPRVQGPGEDICRNYPHPG